MAKTQSDLDLLIKQQRAIIHNRLTQWCDDWDVLWDISEKYSKFAEENEYKKGIYHKWLIEHSHDVKEATLSFHRRKSIEMNTDPDLWICDYCGKEIHSTPKLHHIFYDWDFLYDPHYLQIVHTRCHEKIHEEW